MDKLIAHVFPSYEKAYAHLRDILDEQRIAEIDKTRVRYKERDGTVHRCLVVRTRDDIFNWLAFEFYSSQVHCPGEYTLPTEDYDFMCTMLKLRTRHIPEVA